jgi:ribosomal protein L35AE/L33A
MEGKLRVQTLGQVAVNSRALEYIADAVFYRANPSCLLPYYGEVHRGLIWRLHLDSHVRTGLKLSEELTVRAKALLHSDPHDSQKH